MTAATLSRLPLAAGGTILDSLARTGGWLLWRLFDIGAWGAGQFMRAPVAIAATAAVIGLSTIAGSHALFFEAKRHPAPLFYSAPKAVHSAPSSVPAPRPRPEAIDRQTTGSLGVPAAAVPVGTVQASVPAPAPITPSEIMGLQQKLIDMKLLDGAADGVYGPHTAAAVRTFQAHARIKTDGKLTRELLAVIAAAPVADAPVLHTATTGGNAVPSAPVPLAPLPSIAAGSVAVATPSPAAAQQTPSSPVTVARAAEPVAQTASSETSTSGAALTAAQKLAAQIGTLPPSGTPVGNTSAARVAVASATNTAAVPSQQASGPAPAVSQAISAAPTTVAGQHPLPDATTISDDSTGSTDPVLITKIQRALASLGFLGAKIDGVPGEGTATAIRNFQVFYNYKVTGLASHQLLDLLVQHGATI